MAPRSGPDGSNTVSSTLGHAFFGDNFLDCFLDRFLIDVGIPKLTKIDEKSMPRGTLTWTSNFDRFSFDFCSELGPSEPNLALAG